MLIEHMSQGFDYYTFSHVVDVNQDTLYEWEKHFPIYSEAKKKAFAARSYFVQALNIKCATGQVIVDKKTGEVSTPNPIGVIWLSRNAIGWRNEPKNIELEEKKPITLKYRIEELKDDTKTV